MTEWIEAHAATLSLAAVIATTVLNAVTRHFSEWPRLTKWIGLIVDLLSFIPAKGSPGNAKPLFVPSKAPVDIFARKINTAQGTGPLVTAEEFEALHGPPEPPPTPAQKADPEDAATPTK